jgi:hypothetical protein
MQYKIRHHLCHHRLSNHSDIRRRVFLSVGMLVVSVWALVMPHDIYTITAAGCVINLAWLWS